MTSGNAVALIGTVAAIMAMVAWFDARCLADLRTTSDRELRHFDRNTWALIIVLSFPIGPMLYLAYGKGPGRPW
jgi:hypothetical protein